MEISNKAAYFHYAVEQKFSAGIVLEGSEVKSIRKGKVSFTDSYCVFIDHELWLKNVHITAFENRNQFSVLDEKRDRKLLLQQTELRKLESKVKEKGYAIVPLKLFENEKRYFKLEIALARGKKSPDKRQSLKEKQLQHEIKQVTKQKYRT